MKRHVTRRRLLKGIGAGTFAVTVAGQAAAGEGTRYVVLATVPSARHRIERAGFTVQRTLAEGHVLLVLGSANERADLEAIRGVQEVAHDIEIRLTNPTTQGTAESTDDQHFPRQWDKHALTTDAAIAHDTATGSGSRLAIIDSGTEFHHPDLRPNTNEDIGRLFRQGMVRQGMGPVVLPKDWTNLSKGTETVTRHVANDILGHGTHVSGIAAASNKNTTGVVGTAPDAEIVPLRVGWWTENDEGDAVLVLLFGDILTAVDYAAEIDADALNMSLGTPPLPPQVNAGGIRGTMERVIDTATAQGTVVVNAAGNDATNLDGGDVMYPASIAGAMAISATGPNDKRVFYSNYGKSVIDVGAPGGGYETLAKTLSGEEGDEDTEDEPDVPGVEWPFPTNLVFNAIDPDTLYGQVYGGGSQYLYLAGTSMAAPQVTGTVGLIREIAPHSSAQTVEKAIEQGAELAQGRNADLGAGRLNCAKALEAPVLTR